ncbi:endonuclease [Synechococcus phage DSL-LC02]|nr:endonuclease [Synechococcus phage DSL-LC02]
MYCLECDSTLGKRQKKFCSRKCMNVYNAKEFGIKHREENPNRYKICEECNYILNLNKFSLIEKWNPNSDTKNTCKKCSAKLNEKNRRDRDWKFDAKKILYSNAKQRAKKSNIEFTLTKEDIDIPDTCPVFGFPLRREGRETWMYAPSIDRIDNSKGYVKNNIIIVSRRANILKKDATIDELKKLAEYYEHLRDFAVAS